MKLNHDLHQRDMAGFYTNLPTIPVSLIRASQYAHIWRCYVYFLHHAKIYWVTRKAERSNIRA